MTKDELKQMAEQTAAQIAAIVEHPPFADVESNAVEALILAALQRLQRAQRGRSAMRKRVRVSCGCGWLGRRVHYSCVVCDDPCSHTGYGRCPRCGGRVQSVADRRRQEESDRQADAFWASPEGQQLLARFSEEAPRDGE